MSAKHTPGPWHNGLDVNGNPIVCQQYDGDFLGSEPNEEYQANCRLVSAAPDLLAALKFIADDVTERFDMNDPSTNLGMKLAVKQARAAIAKATGEAL